MADESDKLSELSRSELIANNSYSGVRQPTETNWERRGFLRKALGVLGINVGLFNSTGRTRALTPEEEKIGIEAVREFTDREKREKTVRTHATGVLESLQRRGHLSEASVAELPIDRLHRTVKSYGEATEGTFVFATVEDDRPKVKLQVKKQLPDHELVLVIEPQVGRSRSILRQSDDEDSVRVVTADDDATTQDDCICDSTNKCISDLCGFDCCCDCAKVNVRQFCSDGSCTGCEVIDNSCCGSYQCDIWAS